MTPPQDIPDGKKLMPEPAEMLPQRADNKASNSTSSGTRTTRPFAPERTTRVFALTWVAISLLRRKAALRSALSSAAGATATHSLRGRDLPRGTAGIGSAATFADP